MNTAQCHDKTLLYLCLKLGLRKSVKMSNKLSRVQYKRTGPVTAGPCGREYRWRCYEGHAVGI